MARYQSLNPYYNGRYSTSMGTLNFEVGSSKVLILIIMEDTLRVTLKSKIMSAIKLSLNPYYNGRYSTSYSKTS